MKSSSSETTSCKDAMLENAGFFTRGSVIFLGALICNFLWGSAYPCVKSGMKIMGLSAGQTADIVIYAGERFTLAGIFVIIFGSIIQKKILFPHGKQWPKLFLQCSFQSVGQYIFYYIGLAHATAVNTSIIDSLNYFLAIIFSCLLFRMEKMTVRKTAGCVLGVLGVILININGSGFTTHMTFIGEGMVFISAVSSGLSSNVSKIVAQGDDPVLLSGYQFTAGGLIMIIGALFAGGHFRPFTPGALALLVYLALVSSCAYTLWTILLKYNDVSHVTVYGFMNPVFGVLLSAIILGETEGLGLNYLLALMVISIGIALINLKPGGLKARI